MCVCVCVRPGEEETGECVCPGVRVDAFLSSAAVLLKLGTGRSLQLTLVKVFSGSKV